MSPRARLSLVAFFAVAALVCAWLGVWQVGRLRERRAENQHALQARAGPMVRLNGEMPGDSSLIQRRVEAVGRYDHAHDLVLRGKAYQGTPGVEIVTPLILSGGRAAILVNRGFVPTPDALTVEADSLHEPGEVRVEGIALAVPSGGGAPLANRGRTSWSQLDLTELESRLPYALAPVYIRQLPDTALPRFPRRLAAPAIDDGPHLSYAVQWFAFTVMAVVFGIVMWKQTGSGGKEEHRREGRA